MADQHGRQSPSTPASHHSSQSLPPGQHGSASGQRQQGSPPPLVGQQQELPAAVVNVGNIFVDEHGQTC